MKEFTLDNFIYFYKNVEIYIYSCKIKIMSYIFALNKGNNNFKLDFTDNLDNRNFTHGNDGEILIQFYTEDKDMFLKILNDMMENFKLVDTVENIFESDMSSFLNTIRKCKKKYEYNGNNENFLEVGEGKIESKEETKEKDDIKIKSKVFNCDNKKHEEIEEEKRIKKIKKEVEKKMSRSFDDLNSLSKEFLLSKDRRCYVRNIEQLFCNEFMKDEAVDIMKYFFDDNNFISFNIDILLYKRNYSGFDRKMSYIPFEEMIKLKQKLPKLDILSRAFNVIDTIDNFKIFKKEYLKDTAGSSIYKTKNQRNEYMKNLKYKYEDMKNVRGELTISQIIYLSQNIKLNQKIYDKYFSNIEKDEIDDYGRMFGATTKYEEIKMNLKNNPSISDEMIEKYFI